MKETKIKLRSLRYGSISTITRSFSFFEAIPTKHLPASFFPSGNISFTGFNNFLLVIMLSLEESVQPPRCSGCESRTEVLTLHGATGLVTQILDSRQHCMA